jgi:hypothetical protein
MGRAVSRPLPTPSRMPAAHLGEWRSGEDVAVFPITTEFLSRDSPRLASTARLDQSFHTAEFPPTLRNRIGPLLWSLRR